MVASKYTQLLIELGVKADSIYAVALPFGAKTKLWLLLNLPSEEFSIKYDEGNETITLQRTRQKG
jgi:hypothetical protein